MMNEFSNGLIWSKESYVGSFLKTTLRAFPIILAYIVYEGEGTAFSGEAAAIVTLVMFGCGLIIGWRYVSNWFSGRIIFGSSEAILVEDCLRFFIKVAFGSIIGWCIMLFDVLLLTVNIFVGLTRLTTGVVARKRCEHEEE